MDGHEQNFSIRNIIVRTPENLEITYELAGAGTRAAAYLIDIALVWLAMSLLQNLLVSIIIPLELTDPTYLLGAIGIFSFVVFNSYFIVFELLWAGQSPGKRVVGIRVVKSGGYSLHLTNSVIRNLLRVLDFLPVFYGVGLMSLLTTRYCQRLGDIVAGTLVVYQLPTQTAEELAFSSSREEYSPLPHLQLTSVPPDVIDVCDEFLRTKSGLAPTYRQRVASDLVMLIEQSSGLAPDIRQSDETFLASAVTQYGQNLAGSLVDQ